MHIGAGAFNRSHLAVYLDDLLACEDEPRWGEFAVGLLPADKEIHEGLILQENLYSLMIMDTRIQISRSPALRDHIACGEWGVRLHHHGDCGTRRQQDAGAVQSRPHGSQAQGRGIPLKRHWNGGYDTNNQGITARPV